MMLHQPSTHFDDMKQALALALHEAGQTDTEIGLACGVPPTNIADWRRRNGLAENRPPSKEEPYTPPVRREARPVSRQTVAEPERVQQDASPEIGLACGVPPTNIAEPGENAMEIGTATLNRQPVHIDLDELMTTRLLIQGNSGSGKSHLLRRLLEESAKIVQQVVIDPEGDFATLAETFGHSVVEAANLTADRLATIARRAREHRVDCVLNLADMEREEQMEKATAFLSALFNAPMEHWHPMLVAVDEAQIFAPAADNGEDKELRKNAQQVMSNIMCRGRKRGIAGILATQRIVKLYKNVAAEVSNFLIGRTFEVTDLDRIGSITGMGKAQLQSIAGLKRGEFFAQGPAVTMLQRQATRIRVGDTITKPPRTETGLTPLPSLKPEELEQLLFAEDPETEAEVEIQVRPIPVGPPKLQLVK